MGPRAISVRSAVVGSLLLGAIAAGAGWLEATRPDAYYRLVQEDEWVEWATVWAFVVGATCAAAAAARALRSGQRCAWFLAGLALFLGLVAMEEISWGQRLFGYRPPAYFLEHNFQQELNLHNVLGTGLRKVGLSAVLLLYGVLLPTSRWIAPVRRLMDRLGVVAPPVHWVPVFAGVLALNELYPFEYTGEWVELLLGVGMLFTLIDGLGRGASHRMRLAPVWMLASWLLVAAAGLATATWSRAERAAHPGALEAARAELDALRSDHAAGLLRTRCGVHRRLYTFVRAEQRDAAMEGGSFHALASRGLPEERARFYLDPWNTPYWIRDRCGEQGRRRMIVYSLGPNRVRDSSRDELGGDDLGAVLLELGFRETP